MEKYRKMDVTPEMVDAYISDQMPWMCDDPTGMLRMQQGIAVYTHLQSPGSDDWKRQHGFKID